MRSGVAWNRWVTSRPAITSGTRRPEHDLRGLGVGPDVELAHGVAVAERPAAHHRDAGDPSGEIRRRLQRPGDVGLRSDRDEPDPLGRPAGVDDERDGVGPVERRGRRREVGAVEARFAVHEGREMCRFDQRPIAARVDRHVDAEQVTHHERVAGGPLQRCVPGDGGDADEVGEAGGGDDRHGVVVSRVAVEDHRRRGRAAVDMPAFDMLPSMPPRRAHCRGAFVARRILAVGGVCRGVDAAAAGLLGRRRWRRRCGGRARTDRPRRWTPAPRSECHRRFERTVHRCAGSHDHARGRRGRHRRARARQRRRVLPLVERVRRHVPGSWRCRPRSATDPRDAARAEVAASPTIVAAAAGLDENLPDELATERQALTVGSGGADGAPCRRGGRCARRGRSHRRRDRRDRRRVAGDADRHRPRGADRRPRARSRRRRPLRRGGRVARRGATVDRRGPGADHRCRRRP